MTDTQIVTLILTGIFLFIYIGFHIPTIQDIEKYKKYYNELGRGVYKFEPNVGHSAYFYLHTYDINRLEFTRTGINIIFFPDGDIKLNDNLYLHKSLLLGNLIKWYWFRKFHRLKDDLISEYNIREMFRTRAEMIDSSHYERYMKQQNLNFKFFRG